MFALLINSDNLEKISQVYDISEKDMAEIRIFTISSLKWYLVRGYVSLRGEPQDWVILPEYIIHNKYEYDPEKIDTDWDQIVRK